MPSSFEELNFKSIQNFKTKTRENIEVKSSSLANRGGEDQGAQVVQNRVGRAGEEQEDERW